MAESAIATATTRATSTPTISDPFLDELFADMDVAYERLVAAQDEEERMAGAVDLDAGEQVLATERAALLITGANVIDQLMGLTELGIAVQRQCAGVEAAARMSLARVLPQPALDPPPPSDPYDGGDKTEDFHGLHTAPTVQLDALGNEIPADAPDRPEWWPAVAARVGGWWRRLRSHGQRVWVGVECSVATWIPWGVG